MRKNQPLLVIDTETGGLDCNKHSLLSIAGVLWDPGSRVEPIFDFYVKELFVTAHKKALQVNKIDMNKVWAGLQPYEAIVKIRSALDEHFGTNRKQIQLVGHNVAFDLGFIQRLYKHAGQNFSVKISGIELWIVVLSYNS